MQAGDTWSLQPAVEMSAAEFSIWGQLLEDRIGMVLTEQKRTFLQVNLTARIRELGLPDYAHYYQNLLRGPEALVEWSKLLDRLTIQETQFFRHQPSYDYVAAFLERRLEQVVGRQKNLSLWSLGCATGEEVWSLAMTAARVLQEQADKIGFALTATDISQKALQVARTACYPERRVAAVPQELLQQYFTQEPSGHFQVKQTLAKRICFARLNMLKLAHAPISSMDVIFCQNVLIYFRRWQRREILNQLVTRLSPGGTLVIGLGEITGWQHSEVQPVDNNKVLAFTRKE